MHPYLMLVTAILLFTIQSISFKAFNLRYMKGLPSYFLFQILHFGVVTVLLLVINRGLGEMGTLTVISGCSWGILFVIMLLAYMKAMETGSFSFATLFNSSAVLIPIVWGVFFWGETVTLIQILGLTLLLFTYYMGVDRRDGSFNIRWLVYVLISFSINGALICISKQQQFVMQGEQVYESLIIGFAAAFAMCVFGFLFTRLTQKSSNEIEQAPKPDARFFAIAGVAGIVTAVGNTLVMLMTTRLPSVVQFPVTMGGMVVLTSLVSVVHYKERIGRKGVVAMALGIVSLVLLSL